MSHSQKLVFACALIAVVMIASSLAVMIWRRRGQLGARSFMAMIAGGTIWTLSDALNILSPGNHWVTFAYVGIGILPLAWLAFCVEYTGRGHWLSTRRVQLLALIPAITVPVVATNELHHGMWMNVVEGSKLQVVYGPWHVLSAGYSYLLFLLGYFLLLLNLAESSRVHRRQVILLLLAGLIPWVANLLQVLDVYPRSAPNPTPLAFIVSSLALFWGLFRLQLLEIMPVAQRAIIAQMGDGLVVLESRDRIVLVNPAAEAMLRVRDASVAGRPLAEVLSHWPALVEGVTARDAAHFELSREQEGWTAYFDVQSTVIRHENGHRIGRVFFLCETTVRKQQALERERLVEQLQQGNQCLLAEMQERRKAEQSLRKSEEAWRTFCENSVMGIYRTTPDGKIVMANPALVRMLGFDSFEQLARRDLDKDAYEPSYQRAHFKETIERKGVVVGLEAPWLRRDGTTIWVRENARAIRDDQGGVTYYDGTVEDITQLRNAEEERMRFDQQVQQVQKLESLGVLAGGIAHDFNNLLTAILGNAELALDHAPPASPLGDCLRDIRVSSLRAADLCRQMLAYSGAGRFVVETLRFQELLEGMGQLLKSSVSKKADLLLESTANLPAIRGDVAQIRQVILNLVVNASEALGEGEGEIWITTGAMDCSRDYLRGTYLDDHLPEGRYVWLEVADTGCGMEPGTLRRIFEPFFTTKFLGRGLGLSAVLGIVRGHKGALTVESRCGEGTMVRVLFPAVDNPLAPKGTSCVPAELPSAKGTILLVDDEESVLRIGQRLLEWLGFGVIIARDGQEAVDTYRLRGTDIRLVLMDLSMPRLNGNEAFRELKKLNPQVRVLLSSGYNEADVATRFAGEGLAGFVRKPYTREELSTQLRLALG